MKAIGAAVLAAFGLAGCGGTAERPPEAAPRVAEPAGPLQLGRRSAQSGSVLAALDEAAVGRAIERYRINKQRAAGPVQLAGADLNQDGQPEAVVLFGGADWCAKTGCSLAVFQAGPQGYRILSRSVRVKAPILVAATSTNGWRDLIVSTGGGAAPLRQVRLQFSAGGYSRNAMLEPDAPSEAFAGSVTAIRAPQ